MRNASKGKRKPKPKPLSASSKPHPRWIVLSRSALVVNLLCSFIFVLISSSFSWVVVLGYLLLSLMFIEACFDPWWAEPPYQLQLVAIALVLFLADAFTIGFVLVSAPLSVTGYIRPGDLPGNIVDGILWNAHFSDLRIAVTNPTKEDYSGVDVVVKPDSWVYAAKIYDDESVCTLSAIEGSVLRAAMRSPKANPDMRISVTPVGAGVEFADSEGNVYTTRKFRSDS
jgi:hypothetical protein